MKASPQEIQEIESEMKRTVKMITEINKEGGAKSRKF